MGLDELKFWHWTLISLILGLAFWYTSKGPVEPDRQQQTLEIFESQVLSEDGTQPLATDITVYPAVQATAGQEKVRTTMVVTYTGLTPMVGQAHSYKKEKLWFAAEVPFKPLVTVRMAGNVSPVTRAEWPGVEKLYTPTDPNMSIYQVIVDAYGGFTLDRAQAFRTANRMNGRSGDAKIGRADQLPPTTLAQWYAANPGRLKNAPLIVPWDPSKNRTVMNWLNACQKDCPWVSYHFAWWKLPNMEFALYFGGTVLVVGLIWPTFLWSLTTLGMGKAPKEVYDLKRYGRGKPEPKPVPPPANVLTEDDQKRLAEMEAAYMAKLAGGIGNEGQAQPETAANAEVRRLTETAAAASKTAETPVEDKTYTGQFYPVVLPTHKPEEVKPPPTVEKKSDKKKGT